MFMRASRNYEVSDLVARRVAELRKARGLSAQALADRLEADGFHLSRSSIAKLEARSGRSGVTIDEAVALARILGVSLTALVGDEPITVTATVS